MARYLREWTGVNDIELSYHKYTASFFCKLDLVTTMRKILFTSIKWSSLHEREGWIYYKFFWWEQRFCECLALLQYNGTVFLNITYDNRCRCWKGKTTYNATEARLQQKLGLLMNKKCFFLQKQKLFIIKLYQLF